MRFKDTRQHTRKIEAAKRQGDRDARKAMRLANSNGQWHKGEDTRQ